MTAEEQARIEYMVQAGYTREYAEALVREVRQPATVVQMTERQTQALDLIRAEGPVSVRRVAGALECRSQDAGRIVAALERKGLIDFRYTIRPAGYVATD